MQQDATQAILESEDTTTGMFLTFKIQDQIYGVEIQYVLEIIGIQTITEVPEVADFIKGVINLRGQVIPVMDIRLRFKLPSREYDERTCVIVVHINDCSVGLIVDRVSEVLNIPESQIQPPPSMNQSGSLKFMKGLGKVGNEVKILLDVEKLVTKMENHLSSVSP